LYSYVNKQEFSASSWRSNQGYTKMHGQPTIEILSRILRRQILRKSYIPGVDTYTENRHWTGLMMFHTHKINTGSMS